MGEDHVFGHIHVLYMGEDDAFGLINVLYMGEDHVFGRIHVLYMGEGHVFGHIHILYMDEGDAFGRIYDTNGVKQRNICILNADKHKLRDNISELISKCRYENKFYACNFKPS